MWEASSTVSSCHRTKRSISKSTERSCGVCFAQRQGCGKSNSVCFTTTMHLLTMPWAYGSSWLRRTFSCSTCWNNLPIHLTLLRVTFYFPKLKGVIKGTRFDNVETIKRSVTTEIRGILEESFQQCIEAWPTRMEKCIRLKGNYFEGETM